MSSKCKPIQGLRASPSFNLETLIVNYGIRQLPVCKVKYITLRTYQLLKNIIFTQNFIMAKEKANAEDRAHEVRWASALRRP